MLSELRRIVLHILLLIGFLSISGRAMAQHVPAPDSVSVPVMTPERVASSPVSIDLALRVEEARKAILFMELDRASRLLEVSTESIDEKALVGWTRELAALLTLLVADEESDYEAFLDRNDRLYEQMDDAPESAWRHWLMGEISLQRTWARSKRGNSLKAAWAARRALRHLERAREMDPQFLEPLKGIGLLHMGIGALPDRYRRVLGWFGISGELEEGLIELEQAMSGAAWNRVESAVLLATIDKFGFPSPVDAVRVYEKLWEEYPGSPLIGLSFADVLIRERRPAEALDILARSLDPSGRVHYLSWYRGEALFHLGRCGESVSAFEEYERVHDGPSLKLAGRLMAGQCLELSGQRQRALDWYAMIVDERGFAEEQAAMRKASELLQRPLTGMEIRLLTAWGAFNSGWDDQAMSLFADLLASPEIGGEDQAEAAYGVARIHHEAGRTEDAISAYMAALDLPADPLEKWHGFARMHLVSLFLEQGNQRDARFMLDQIERMPEPYDFRASVENRTRLMQME